MFRITTVQMFCAVCVIALLALGALPVAAQVGHSLTG